MLNIGKKISRRGQLGIVLAGAFALLLAANLDAAPKKAAPKAKAQITRPEPFMGSANAPLTLIEYGSMTCWHCAQFSKNDFPTIKARYIDTGKVKFIFRTLPTEPAQLSMGMQVIADCAGPRRFEVIEAFFNMQDYVLAATKRPTSVLPKLLEIGRYNGGLSEDASKQCLANEANAQRVAQIAQTGIDLYRLESTPSFILNNRLIPSPLKGHDAASVSAAIDNALAPRRPAKGTRG